MRGWRRAPSRQCSITSPESDPPRVADSRQSRQVEGAVQRTAGISIGGAPWTAQLETVEILKERRILGRHVYVVSFEADHLRAGRLPMTMVVRAEHVPGDGWIARGISAGASVPELAVDAPRVLLGGSWGRFGFCGGGRVCGSTPEIAAARLRFSNGIELEDDVEGGWALFFTDQPVERPSAVVELCDATGTAGRAINGRPATTCPARCAAASRSS